MNESIQISRALLARLAAARGVSDADFKAVHCLLTETGVVPDDIPEMGVAFFRTARLRRLKPAQPVVVPVFDRYEGRHKLQVLRLHGFWFGTNAPTHEPEWFVVAFDVERQRVVDIRFADLVMTVEVEGSDAGSR